jgi:putative transposase
MAKIKGRPPEKLVLTAEQREQLEAYSRSRSMPAGLMARFRIVLLSAEGLSGAEVAERVGVCRATVYTWRKRFRTRGIGGLHDELRPGRPRTIEDEAVAEVIRRTVTEKPRDGGRWTQRSMAEAVGISSNSVQRIWHTFGLKPHLDDTFKLSNDPFFVEKVRDVVGLYLDPPSNAVVLCVDEKSQCQALERTQPGLPMGFGYVEGYTHDYVRHGTTTLFAALDVATGKVLGRCRKRHRHQEYLQFLRLIDSNVPNELDVHLIVDNYATHKHQKVRTWLARHPRFHVHFTPTYSSWLNQVEAWFGIISRRAIRRGSFRSCKELVARIDDFIAAYNENATPFAWTATAESILAKLQRLCRDISIAGH